ncbi:MAG: MarC family protein [Victivallales bacterium]
MAYFINNFLKFVFLLTPFFVLSMFLSMTQGWAMRQKRLLALRIGIAAFCTCMILLFFGKWIFEAFDITLDAFRIGGGALLFLSAVGLVNGKVEDKKPLTVEDDSEARISDIAVVPLAIPVTVGPGTIAALLVIGADASTVKTHLLSAGALALALFCLTSILFVATWIEQKFGRHVIVILSKVTGLILAAMASQMIFTGVRSFLVP